MLRYGSTHSDESVNLTFDTVPGPAPLKVGKISARDACHDYTRHLDVRGVASRPRARARGTTTSRDAFMNSIYFLRTFYL